MGNTNSSGQADSQMPVNTRRKLSAKDAMPAYGEEMKHTDNPLDYEKMNPPIAQSNGHDAKKAVAHAHKQPDPEPESEDDEEEDEWCEAVVHQQARAKGKRKKRNKKAAAKMQDNKRAADQGTSSRSDHQRTRSASEPRRVQWGRVHITAFERKLSIDSVPASGAWPLGIGGSEKAKLETTVDEYEALKEEDLNKRIQELPKRLRKVATGETRQFDYKATKERNPIFGPLEEKDRKMAILQAITAVPADGKKVIIEAEEVEKVLVVELNDIRASRKNVGCSCHHSKSPDKLSLKKLKEELHRRHISAQGTDKVKLAALLKEAMANEKLCVAEECECFLAGVPCHADVCGCCVGKKCKGSVDCSNPKGNQCYKEEEVRSYRASFLSVQARPRSVTMP